MGINKKGKRKICVENKEYVWYVNEDYDSLYDKRLHKSVIKFKKKADKVYP